MPNRIIKESIWSSENLSKVSLLAQGFFMRLLPLPDDHGCFDARPSILRARLFPLNYGQVTEKQIEKWLQELVVIDCVRLWTDSGVRYGYIPAWNKHQSIRSTHHRKTPAPPMQIVTGVVEKSDVENKGDSNCKQVHADARLNPNPNPVPNPNPDPVLIERVEPDSSLAGASPPARVRDTAADLFCEFYERATGVPYAARRGDFVQLAALRRALTVESRASPPGWETAIGNYFASPLASYTLADLSARFGTFRNTALDRYNKPIAHVGAKPYEESAAERAIRKTKENRLDRALGLDYGGELQAGNHERTKDSIPVFHAHGPTGSA